MEWLKRVDAEEMDRGESGGWGLRGVCEDTHGGGKGGGGGGCRSSRCFHVSAGAGNGTLTAHCHPAEMSSNTSGNLRRKPDEGIRVAGSSSRKSLAL